MTIEYMRAKRLSYILKKIMPKIPIIIGGVHISTLPISLDKNFDVGVIGEAEITFLELIKDYEKNKLFKHENLKKLKAPYITTMEKYSKLKKEN